EEAVDLGLRIGDPTGLEPRTRPGIIPCQLGEHAGQLGDDYTSLQANHSQCRPSIEEGDENRAPPHIREIHRAVLPVMAERRYVFLAQQRRELITGREIRGHERRERRAVEVRLAGGAQQASRPVHQQRCTQAGLHHVPRDQPLEALLVTRTNERDGIAVRHPTTSSEGKTLRWTSSSMRSRIWSARRRSRGRGSQATKSRSSWMTSTVASWRAR